LSELDPDKEIVVYCHHGVRSFQVAAFMAGRGYDNVVNLDGGIDAWSLSIDSDVPRYG
jgi:rhodanese-related sulfurtransferase